MTMDKTTERTKAFGSLIRQARQELRLTQREVSRRSNVGKTYIPRLESGSSRPSERVVRRLARALELDSEQLLAVLGDDVALPRSWR